MAGVRDAPAHLLFGPAGPLLDAPARTDPVPSPDGSLLAWISDVGGRPCAYVAPLPADGSPVAEPERPLPARPSRSPGADLPPDVTSIAWSPDGRWLACEIAPAGGERTRVVLVTPDGSDQQEIAPSAAAVRLGAWSPTGRAVGVTIHPAGGRGDGYACLVDVRDGSSTVLAVGPAAVVCGVGGDGRRAVVRTGRRGDRRLELIDLRSGRRTELLAGATVAAARFGVTGRTLYLHTDAGREHPALLAVTLGEGDEVSLTRVVAARDDQDLDLVALDPGGVRAALVWNAGGRSELELADLRSARPVAMPSSLDVVTGASFTRDGAALLVAGHGHAAPPHVLRLALPASTRPDNDRPTRQESRAAGPRTEATRPTPLLPSVVSGGEGLVRPVAEGFTGEDGLALSGWLLRPPGADGPHPTLIWLHGGPEAEERPGFAPLLQALAARGVAVFAPNVRGSGGRGRTFSQADDLDRRAFSITDVRAAVTHLTGTGLADPARIAVAGRSYGGYLTLAALTRFPELFAAGVDVCGMSDLPAFYDDTEPWIGAAATTKYGDPHDDAALLAALSPIHDAGRITAPLLVVHGGHDTNVPLGQARAIVEALRGRGATAELLLLDDEGHEVHDRHTRARFVRAVTGFVVDALGRG
ncbi:MAG: alpha/beta fold hydrolase [Pseudonocardia sediminis]